MRCGLLGEKLGHSYSPELHAFFGNYDYELFEVPPDQLGDFIRARDFQGLNVTIPYKTTMLAICDDLTEAAPAVVTAIGMPFTFSIAHGIAFGFITYASAKLLAGRARELSPMVAAIAVLFVLKFAFL